MLNKKCAIEIFKNEFLNLKILNIFKIMALVMPTIDFTYLQILKVGSYKSVSSLSKQIELFQNF